MRDSVDAAETLLDVNARSYLEDAAAVIVGALTGLRLDRLDAGRGEQLPDFALVGPVGTRLGVLEVTSTISMQRASFDAAKAKHRWHEPTLRRSWMIRPKTTQVDVKRLRQRLPHILLALERNGFPDGLVPVLPYGFEVGNEFPHERELADLGVETIWQLPAASVRPGHIVVQTPAHGGWLGPDLVTTAVTVELNKSDNLAKLKVAPGESAELFVWLADSEAAVALTSPIVFPDIPTSWPSDAPELPSGVTRVWAATGPYDRDTLARALWSSDGSVWIVHTALPRPS